MIRGWSFPQDDLSTVACTSEEGSDDSGPHSHSGGVRQGREPREELRPPLKSLLHPKLKSVDGP
jgi:hypothetical protein